MAILRRADKVVVRQVHDVREGPKVAGNPVAESLCFDAGQFGRFVDLLAVLVGPGQKHDIEAIEPLEAGDYVAGKRCIGVTDVRHVVDVVDRRRDVEGVGRGHVQAARRAAGWPRAACASVANALRSTCFRSRLR